MALVATSVRAPANEYDHSVERKTPSLISSMKSSLMDGPHSGAKMLTKSMSFFSRNKEASQTTADLQAKPKLLKSPSILQRSPAPEGQVQVHSEATTPVSTHERGLAKSSTFNQRGAAVASPLPQHVQVTTQISPPEPSPVIVSTEAPRASDLPMSPTVVHRAVETPASLTSKSPTLSKSISFLTRHDQSDNGVVNGASAVDNQANVIPSAATFFRSASIIYCHEFEKDSDSSNSSLKITDGTLQTDAADHQSEEPKVVTKPSTYPDLVVPKKFTTRTLLRPSSFVIRQERISEVLDDESDNIKLSRPPSISKSSSLHGSAIQEEEDEAEDDYEEESLESQSVPPPPATAVNKSIRSSSKGAPLEFELALVVSPDSTLTPSSSIPNRGLAKDAAPSPPFKNETSTSLVSSGATTQRLSTRTESSDNFLNASRDRRELQKLQDENDNLRVQMAELEQDLQAQLDSKMELKLETIRIFTKAMKDFRDFVERHGLQLGPQEVEIGPLSIIPDPQSK